MAKRIKQQPKNEKGQFVDGPKIVQSTADLLKSAPVQSDRTGWARRGHVEFHPNQVLALEVVDNNLIDAAERLDEWAVTLGGPVSEIQHVFRRGKRVVYGRVTP